MQIDSAQLAGDKYDLRESAVTPLGFGNTRSCITRTGSYVWMGVIQFRRIVPAEVLTSFIIRFKAFVCSCEILWYSNEFLSVFWWLRWVFPQIRHILISLISMKWIKSCITSRTHSILIPIPIFIVQFFVLYCTVGRPPVRWVDDISKMAG